MESHQRESHLQHTKLGRRRCRVILFPFPLQGHINPMLQLASILYSRGISITIIHTKFNSPNSSNYPHFNFFSFQDGLSEIEASTADVVSLTSLLNIKFLVPFQDCLVKVLSNNVDHQENSDSSTGCLIVDAAWNITQAIPETCKLPWITLRTTSVCSFLAFAALPLLQENGALAMFDSKSEALLPELPPLRVKDLPLVKTDHPETFVQLVSDLVVNQIKISSGVIWNSFQALEQDSLNKLHQDFPIPMFPIGPFHNYFTASSSSLLSQDQTSISWLDKQAPNSVIYVSFGSIAKVNKTEFLEIAWGLANTNLPFLWVVRTGLVHGAEWIDPLPERFLEKLSGRGHIVKWAPQPQVLAHSAIGGFWTHSGWNSTLESICEGVPMICQPYFGDQMVNARYVSDVWRVGFHLERRLERGEIEKVIRRLMVGIEGQEMRDRIVSLKEKVDVCLRQGGSSHQALEKLINYIMSL
ncbi:hypothetical protein Ddye_013597 [Dipteronia dyeriana]|uniref:UDP-glycosyltransferase n=1 Tax=Dipteronia dyeriana TaxID=168575 RepID=A0AAE0CJT3_9ROSI|nr:hypothetical protein Ddye_013597 [Dipteronia dyeriana]